MQITATKTPLKSAAAIWVTCLTLGVVAGAVAEAGWVEAGTTLLTGSENRAPTSPADGPSDGEAAPPDGPDSSPGGVGTSPASTSTTTPSSAVSAGVPGGGGPRTAPPTGGAAGESGTTATYGLHVESPREGAAQVTVNQDPATTANTQAPAETTTTTASSGPTTTTPALPSTTSPTTTTPPTTWPGGPDTVG